MCLCVCVCACVLQRLVCQYVCLENTTYFEMTTRVIIICLINSAEPANRVHFLHTEKYMCKHMYVCMHLCMCVCTKYGYMCVYVCMNVCMYVCVYGKEGKREQ